LEFQRRFGEFQHQAQREPVSITRHGRRELVLMSADHYDWLVAAAHTLLREELRRPLDEKRKAEGTKTYLQMRDGPFQPEPFGPRAKRRE
jgi:prevent-host-death family protein